MIPVIQFSASFNWLCLPRLFSLVSTYREGLFADNTECRNKPILYICVYCDTNITTKIFGTLKDKTYAISRYEILGLTKCMLYKRCDHPRSAFHYLSEYSG